ncbi:hypothetical protein ABW20_dc0102037 [Dactylellina cionopaga]|nr:hypothetical protein ABW20_dc0102037 [Dactylellina cionopaga]
MMMSSAVVRKTALCQSSYFFSVARGTAERDGIWDNVLTQTGDAFGVLTRALQMIDTSGAAEHVACAVRIMTSIMQMQRFEIAISSFDNCQSHLNAAVALFRQLLDSAGATEQPAGPRSSFKALIARLGPSSWIEPSICVQIPNAEQAAFRFSSALLILDDIIASTVLQEQPRLYEYHHCLLGYIDGVDPPVNLEAVFGCQNWVMLQMGEIAALDAWKQRCKAVGNLDVMELVQRAAIIKEFLLVHLTRLEIDPAMVSKEGRRLPDAFANNFQQSEMLDGQSIIVTRVWAHAALVYLFIVVSGWQPASADVRYHVDRIVQLLTQQISPPTLLSTVPWPFCIAGCLAEPAQEPHLRAMVKALQPPSIFGTVHKALEIMEDVWHHRGTGDMAARDLAMDLTKSLYMRLTS